MFLVIRDSDQKVIRKFEDMVDAQLLAEDLMDRNIRAYSVCDEDAAVLVRCDPAVMHTINRYKIKGRAVSEKAISRLMRELSHE